MPPPPLLMIVLPFHAMLLARRPSSSASVLVLNATKAMVTIDACPGSRSVLGFDETLIPQGLMGIVAGNERMKVSISAG